MKNFFACKFFSSRRLHALHHDVRHALHHAVHHALRLVLLQMSLLVFVLCRARPRWNQRKPLSAQGAITSVTAVSSKRRARCPTRLPSRANDMKSGKRTWLHIWARSVGSNPQSLHSLFWGKNSLRVFSFYKFFFQVVNLSQFVHAKNEAFFFYHELFKPNSFFGQNALRPRSGFFKKGLFSLCW